jgi:hypothetical protein
MPRRSKQAKQLLAQIDYLERLNRGIDPKRALQYLGKEFVETKDEREWVLWRMEQDK